MMLENINIQKLSKEELQEIKKLCFYINEEHHQEIFALTEDDIIHTIFVLEHQKKENRTVQEVFFHTKIESQGKGYTLIGFQLLFDYMRSRNDIETVSIASYNPIAIDVANQNQLVYEDDWTYNFYNPNYDREQVRIKK